jgi:hypothetical protein
VKSRVSSTLAFEPTSFFMCFAGQIPSTPIRRRYSS